MKKVLFRFWVVGSVLWLPFTSFAEDIRDVKAPVAFPFSFILLYVILAVLVGIGIVFFLRRYLFKKKTKIPTIVIIPKRPPWEIAFEQLNKLIKANFLARGNFGQYFFDLSNIIRFYIERRFNIKAPEMTTEEFLISLRSSADLTGDQKDVLKNFLMVSDMVKFARYKPEIKEAENGFDLAKKFIEDTIQGKGEGN